VPTNFSISSVLPLSQRFLEGADEFLDIVGSSFISTVLTATEDHELTRNYMVVMTIMEHASPEKTASGIPASELRTFMEHMRDTLKTLSSDLHWLRSGTLKGHHELLLRTVAYFSMRPSFLKVFLVNEGMEAVAKFYASRKKNDTPDHIVAQSILLLVNSALMSLSEEGTNVKKGIVLLRKQVFLGSLFAAFLWIPNMLLVL
jgi:hypothetical protein